VASPQKENGYTAIANELMDAIIAANLSGQELRIALLIIRKTYGFNKKEDVVSLTQMMSATGMGKIRCSQVVNRLQLMQILTVTENLNGISKKYSFNKDFESWNTVNADINRYRKTKSTVKVLRNRPLRKTLTTKDIITKDTLTKAKAPPQPLPEWIKQDSWDAFTEMRKAIKKPVTPKAATLIWAKLKRIRAETGDDPNEVLDQSTMSSWQGVFAIKREEKRNGAFNNRDRGFRGQPGQGANLSDETERAIAEANALVRRKRDLAEQADVPDFTDPQGDPRP